MARILQRYQYLGPEGPKWTKWFPTRFQCETLEEGNKIIRTLPSIEARLSHGKTLKIEYTIK